MTNCCVYFHKDSDGIIKYIGSGNIKRAYRSNHRSKAWNELFKYNKPTVEIVAMDLSKDNSLKLEHDLILKHSDTVVNCVKPCVVVEHSFEIINSMFYVDETSPSCLRWKIPSGRYGRYPACSVAGSLQGKVGHRYWNINTKDFHISAHRAVYLLTHGSIDSSLVINHINGNTSDNRPCNLEMITQSSNTFKRKKTPSSFTDGLSFRIMKGKYTFAIMTVSVNNKEYKKSVGVMTHGLMEATCEVIAFRKRILAEHNIEQ